MEQPQREGFHARDGLYFRRGSDGSVTVYVPEPGEHTLTAQQWASIVASVSASGEGFVSYGSAYRFHQGSDEQRRSA